MKRNGREGRVLGSILVAACGVLLALPAAAKEVKIRGFGTTPRTVRTQIDADLAAYAKGELKLDAFLAHLTEHGDRALPYLGRLLQRDKVKSLRGQLAWEHYRI